VSGIRALGSAASPWLVAVLGVVGALTCLPFLTELPPHLDAARALAAGRAIEDRFYPIGYPAVIALGHALRGIAGVIAEQALLYGATLALFHTLLRRAGATALLAGLATAALALHPYLLLNIQRINDNATNAPLLLVLVGLMVDPALWRARATPLALGAAMGLLVAIRPNALLLACLPLILMAGEDRAVRRGACYLAAGLAVFAGLSIVATGEPLFFPRNGPYNLFAGNNPLTAAALRESYNGEPSVAPALAAAGIATDAPTALPARTYYALVGSFVAAHPGDALALAALKLANLLRPDWQFADDALEAAAQAVVALPIVLWLIAWSADPRYRASRRGRIMVAVLLLFVAPFALTNSDPRFRLPLDVVLLLECVTVFAASPWARRWRARDTAAVGYKESGEGGPMARRGIVAAGLCAAALAAAAYWYSPRLALDALQIALAQRDVVALERQVDWPQVRGGIRADVTGLLAANAAQSAGGTGIGAAVGSMLATALGPTVVPFLVDTVVSPQGVIRLLDYRERVDGRKVVLAVDRMGFTAVDEFTVWIAWPGDPVLARAVLVREGVRWRVARVVLPLDAWLALARAGGS
jgi:hypothetical protein